MKITNMIFELDLPKEKQLFSFPNYYCHVQKKGQF